MGSLTHLAPNQYLNWDSTNPMMAFPANKQKHYDRRGRRPFIRDYLFCTRFLCFVLGVNCFFLEGVWVGFFTKTDSLIIITKVKFYRIKLKMIDSFIEFNEASTFKKSSYNR